VSSDAKKPDKAATVLKIADSAGKAALSAVVTPAITALGIHAGISTPEAAMMGSATGKFVADVLPLAIKRFFSGSLNRWWQGVDSSFAKIQEEQPKFKIEDLPKNDAFMSALVRATLIAAGTNQDEKRRFLRNALINIATESAPDEDIQQIYLSAIETFTPTHVHILDVMCNGFSRLRQQGIDTSATSRTPFRTYGSLIEQLLPKLNGQQDLVQAAMSDLANRGFTTARAPGDVIQHPLITNFGGRFLQFVTKPEEEAAFSHLSAAEIA
jgi:hypothetical protein